MHFAQTHPGDQILRVSAEHAAEHIYGILVLPGFQHRLAQQPIGFQVPGILLQNVLPVGCSLRKPALFNHAINLPTILAQGSLAHRFPLFHSVQITLGLCNGLRKKSIQAVYLFQFGDQRFDRPF